MKPDLSLLGLGLYSPSEAAALTHVPPQRIRRWLTGHRSGDKGYPALWRSQLEKFEIEQLCLSFLDLVQLRVVDAFINEGLSAQKVRRAIELGSEIVSDYPFANARFRTDGKTLILQVLDDNGDDDKLIDLFKSGQYLMQKVIEPSLKNLEFEDDVATRWWPLGRAKGVVIDPKRQFGQPIDDATGVPTSVLAQAAQTEGSPAIAAKRFMVPVASVHRAVAFELQHAA
ncbi:hypothetical protein QCM80_02515 [Bradyrhizobium sp. SSUT112]|uniref:hypothetical protein n=1 Tax=Bradyrhizobium sp. SSUT112 TaxID=3040604 RepID=UPI00244D2F43|nr:hypothetical protein [Bradyrhizobium sp. SSUT112]MDH2349557.1 hypothetical protein [Bradyrhizobium sp. SSUT112]